MGTAQDTIVGVDWDIAKVILEQDTRNRVTRSARAYCVYLISSLDGKAHIHKDALVSLLVDVYHYPVSSAKRDVKQFTEVYSIYGADLVFASVDSDGFIHRNSIKKIRSALGIGSVRSVPMKRSELANPRAFSKNLYSIVVSSAKRLDDGTNAGATVISRASKKKLTGYCGASQRRIEATVVLASVPSFLYVQDSGMQDKERFRPVGIWGIIQGRNVDHYALDGDVNMNPAGYHKAGIAVQERVRLCPEKGDTSVVQTVGRQGIAPEALVEAVMFRHVTVDMFVGYFRRKTDNKLVTLWERVNKASFDDLPYARRPQDARVARAKIILDAWKSDMYKHLYGDTDSKCKGFYRVNGQDALFS